nr:hypothetical protein GCM10020092_080050 [Actinoplanes digitatis]
MEIGRVLKLDPARVDATAPFDSMGFDSLLSLELKKLLESAVEVALPATLAWRFPTIDALVPFLAERMGMALDTATVDTGPAAPVLDVETLSDTDIEALLLDRLQAIEADPT